MSYTLEFDAYVQGVRRLADPEHAIKFVGLTNPNIDSADKVVAWATYFLNASNHDPSVGPDAYAYIGYHAYPTNGGYTKDPATLARMFDYVDDYIDNKVLAVDKVIAALSPLTETVLDETGADMDGVLGPGPPPGNNPRYWVAAAAYWAYMWARAARDSATVRAVGASQFMDAPGQEPSVTLVDWSTGKGTARFWVVDLLARGLVQGHKLVATTAAAGPGGRLFAQGFAAPGGGGERALVINQADAWANVTLACPAGGPCGCSFVDVIDEATALEPARRDVCGPGNTIQLAPYATAIVTLQ